MTDMSNNSHDGIFAFEPDEDTFNKGLPHCAKLLHSIGAHRNGIAKVIPPKSWKPRKNMDYDDVNKIIIPELHVEDYAGRNGVYNTIGGVLGGKTVAEYKEMAESFKYKPPPCNNRAMDAIFWKGLDQDSETKPLYGKEIHMSLFDKDQKLWNLNQLNSLLDVTVIAGMPNAGITDSFTYFGMYATSFVWHIEDRNLYSVNYHHFGAAKVWYAVPLQYGHKLEKLAAQYLPGSSKFCDNPMGHKTTLMSPEFLDKHGIPYNRIEQHPGEFIITFPYGYHCGYNQGFNCTEAVNFATEHWFDYALTAKRCVCETNRQDLPALLFLKLQPELYNASRRGELEVTLDYNACPPAPTSPCITWKDKAEENWKKFNEDRSFQGLPQLDFRQFLLDIEDIGSSSSSSQEQHPVKNEIRTLDVNIPQIWGRLMERHKKQRLGLKTGTSCKKGDQVSFEQEMKANCRQGKVFPFCSVCRIFTVEEQILDERKVFHGVVNDIEPRSSPDSRFKFSPVLVSEYVFECSKMDPDIIIQKAGNPAGSTSELLECSACKVVVHARCYGVDSQVMEELERNDEKPWFCDRCEMQRVGKIVLKASFGTEHLENANWSSLRSEKNDKVACLLCKRYTGAMKKVSNLSSQWVHLTCAIASQHVITFGKTRSDITASRQLKDKDTRPCIYCKPAGKLLKVSTPATSKGMDIGTSAGVTIECWDKKCRNTFHITCALERGAFVTLGNWPYPVYPYCVGCTEDFYLCERKTNFSESVKAGATVKTGKSTFVVQSIVEQSLHHVYVAGEPGLAYVKQEEFVDHDWSSYPKKGADVLIKRPDDEKIRIGQYVSFEIETLYEVIYGDGSTSQLTLYDLEETGGRLVKTTRNPASLKRKRTKKSVKKGGNGDGESKEKRSPSEQSLLH